MEQAKPTQEIAHDLPPIVGEHRLGMELHAPVRQPIDLERLNDAILAAGMNGDTEDLVNLQGVVAHYLEVLRDSSKDSLARVANGRDKTVARLRRTRNLGAGQQAQPFVAKAYAQHRNLGRGCGGNDGSGSTEILLPFRPARTRRNHHLRKLARTDALGEPLRLTGSDDEWLAACYLRDEVGEVKGIRIVIIKQRDHREVEFL